MIIKETNNDTVIITNVLLKDLEKFIYRKLDENSLWADDVKVYEDDDEIWIEINISWGDWKHEHLRLDYLIMDILYEYNPKLAYNCSKVDEEITEEDGSDTYSAIHNYVIEL